MCEEYDIYRQCYCGCVYAAQAQNIDLFKVKKDATAFLLIRTLKRLFPYQIYCYEIRYIEIPPAVKLVFK